MPEHTFKTLFCAHFHCAPGEFEERAFKECLYSRSNLLLWVIRKFWPRFFAEDFAFLNDLGFTTAPRDAAAVCQAFQSANRDTGNFLRNRLKLRVSGRKGLELAERLFATTTPPPLTPTSKYPAS